MARRQRFSSKRSTFSCIVNYFLSSQSNSLCNLGLFLQTPLQFSCNINFFLNIRFFSATPNFCFRLLKLLCHGNIFLLLHSIKNITTFKKKKKSFLCCTKKLTSFFCASQILHIHFSLLHIGSMLIFFLETMKLSIFSCLLTCFNS